MAIAATTTPPVPIPRAAGGTPRAEGPATTICMAGREGVAPPGADSEGRGRDSLRGGSGNDNLHGGPRGDRLNGGPGNDALQGDGGLASLSETKARPGPDRLRGGRGVDIVAYNFYSPFVAP